MKLEIFKEKIKGKFFIVGSGSEDPGKFFNEALECIYKLGFEIIKTRRKKNEPK